MKLTIAILFLFFLLTGCASTPERYDYDGARPAGAPAFRPELDAPHQRGQPGQIDPERKTLPPSPNKRPYEPRMDGNAQMMAADGDARRALLLKIQRPVPGRVPPGATEEMWKQCWADTVKALLAHREEVASLNELEMECVRHIVLGQCGNWLMGRAGEAKKGDGTKADRKVMEKFFPAGEWDEREWDEHMVNEHERRRSSKCEGRGAYNDRTADLAVRVEQYAYERLGWRDGVP